MFCSKGGFRLTIDDALKIGDDWATRHLDGDRESSHVEGIP